MNQTIEFQQNEHGHYTCTVSSKKYQAVHIHNSLGCVGGQMSCFAHEVINNAYRGEDYIEGGVECYIAIVPTKEMTWEEKLLINLPSYAQRHSYQQMPIGIAPALRMAIWPWVMDDMGWDYIALFHTPVNDDNGTPRVLRLSRGDLYDAQNLLRALYCEPEYRYNDKGAIAFLVSQNGSLI